MSTDQPKHLRKLHILFIVTADGQADPLINQLQESGYDLSHEVMARSDATRETVSENHWDLVFCQYDESSTTEQFPHLVDTIKDITPVVYFAQTASEESVAEAMKSGISDFIVGGNSIHLVALIEREFNRNKVIRECSRNHERYQEIIDTSSDAIIALDSGWKINFFSKGAESLFGYTHDEAIDRSYASLIQTSQPREKSLNNTPGDTNEFNLAKRRDITVRCKDGSTLACEMNMSRSRVKGDKRIYTVILRDISDRKAKEEELIRLANYDALTNIFNRHSFYKALEQEIRQADRDKTRFALLYIDLDGFKEVNDNMGHIAGDQLLRELANRLKLSLREVDTVARMGGDEFIVILHNINVVGHATRVADKILELTSQPFSISEEEVTIGASLGISIYPDDSNDHEKLISFADSALYLAKTRGRNQYVLYRDADADADE